ncbi:hypothetical protein ACI68E_004293 [Malassezia pachydermatis]
MGKRGVFPLVKFGAYTLTVETAFVALCVGILALAPPPIVGGMGAIPAWGKYVVAVIAFVLAAWQIVGFASIMADHTVLFRWYSRVTFIGTIIILIFTIAFMATAAGLHDNVIPTCLANFEQPLANDGFGIQQVQDRLDQGRRDVCNILAWADVGLMAGLIIVVGLMQLYMCYMLHKYGQRQRAAEKEARMNPAPVSLPMQDTKQWNTFGQPRYEPVQPQEQTDMHYATYTR